MKTNLWGRYGQKVKLRPDHEELCKLYQGIWPLFYGQWELAYNGVPIGKILKENTKILLII